MSPRSPYALVFRIAGIALMLFMFLSALIITVFSLVLLATGGSQLPTYGLSISIAVLGAVATVLTGMGLLHYVRPRSGTA
ncbi:MAG TPA: hypothetical protein VNM16_07425 [Bacillota bacterium]|nr:hypothetical protein [Bacillota bacterium]